MRSKAPLPYIIVTYPMIQWLLYLQTTDALFIFIQNMAKHMYNYLKIEFICKIPEHILSWPFVLSSSSVSSAGQVSLASLLNNLTNSTTAPATPITPGGSKLSPGYIFKNFFKCVPTLCWWSFIKTYFQSVTFCFELMIFYFFSCLAPKCSFFFMPAWSWVCAFVHIYFFNFCYFWNH